MTTYGDLFGQPLTLKEMSPYLPKAVIATEDRRFYSHFGIDPIGLGAGSLRQHRAGHVVQGGSTITQQLAKNLFLTPERSLTRKIQETLLALWLEHRFSKDQILEIYLNRVYLGAGTYGVDAAAHRYFEKSARQTTLYESAVLAGLLKAPTRFNPTHDRDKAAARTAQVLANMVEAGYHHRRPNPLPRSKAARSLAAVTVIRPGARYFADWVAEQLGDFTDTDNRDLTVVTTLDPRMQAEAEAAISETSATTGRQDDAAARRRWWRCRPREPCEPWWVAAITRKASSIGRRRPSVSRARRSSRSSISPGWKRDCSRPDRFVDAPIRVGGWQPRDFAGHYQGEMSLAEGSAQSINTIAVQVAQRAGIRNVVAVARRLGIASELPSGAELCARHR